MSCCTRSYLKVSRCAWVSSSSDPCGIVSSSKISFLTFYTTGRRTKCIWELWSSMQVFSPDLYHDCAFKNGGGIHFSRCMLCPSSWPVLCWFWLLNGKKRVFLLKRTDTLPYFPYFQFRLKKIDEQYVLTSRCPLATLRSSITLIRLRVARAAESHGSSRSRRIFVCSELCPQIFAKCLMGLDLTAALQ